MDSSNPEMTLVKCALEGALERLETDGEDAAAWAEAQQALTHHSVAESDDEDLALAIAAQDKDALAEIVEGWNSGQRLLLERDRAVLKRAMKAYRKRLKITVLDAESSLSGGHMSSGRTSDIVGIVPPERYPRATWDELARQKRLIADGRGTYELPPGG